ncbi:hypothetical protein ACOME3_006591 [Neoechinorhynchus agilis]
MFLTKLVCFCLNLPTNNVEFRMDILLCDIRRQSSQRYRRFNAMISFKVQNIANIASGTNLFAKLYFSYVAPIFFRIHRPLHETDISGLPEQRKASRAGREIERYQKNIMCK